MRKIHLHCWRFFALLALAGAAIGGCGNSELEENVQALSKQTVELKTEVEQLKQRLHDAGAKTEIPDNKLQQPVKPKFFSRVFVHTTDSVDRDALTQALTVHPLEASIARGKAFIEVKSTDRRRQRNISTRQVANLAAQEGVAGTYPVAELSLPAVLAGTIMDQSFAPDITVLGISEPFAKHLAEVEAFQTGGEQEAVPAIVSADLLAHLLSVAKKVSGMSLLIEGASQESIFWTLRKQSLQGNFQLLVGISQVANVQTKKTKGLTLEIVGIADVTSGLAILVPEATVRNVHEWYFEPAP